MSGLNKLISATAREIKVISMSVKIPTVPTMFKSSIVRFVSKTISTFTF